MPISSLQRAHTGASLTSTNPACPQPKAAVVRGQLRHHHVDSPARIELTAYFSHLSSGVPWVLARRPMHIGYRNLRAWNWGLAWLCICKCVLLRLLRRNFQPRRYPANSHGWNQVPNEGSWSYCGALYNTITALFPLVVLPATSVACFTAPRSRWVPDSGSSPMTVGPSSSNQWLNMPFQFPTIMDHHAIPSCTS